ncbi:probable alpha-glucosidase protein [Fulvimarina pelagi HTCC2506]|uniref:Probable alpha-glucosidase protein n=1 Tax=Fulvimarina pelagi HTCC2506 TaxID=314231 RepID=Q0G3Y7_9HYPH|nr:alpha-glucosidase [Fulvimarina pelagi]EAU41694.1 probable alpha-glucosidase protein [Fulvimarina pelagi HTCC2506]
MLDQVHDIQLSATGQLIQDPDWWRGAVIYQIYPRSFQDTNGDGIGDLAGITKRLDYVASLGVDAIWLSPFFTSPMKDFGYDVADYRDVDPIFGTIADFDALVERAHALGLKVIIDQVISHSSDKHPWFEESRQSRDNPKADWYVWADPKEDGSPPNNWLSVFSGPAWRWSSRRRQYYLHNFLTEQPDLNFHNPEVRSALLGEMRFWLERGVDGFRLDTANFYFHDAELRDNPPLPEAMRSETYASRADPYNFQHHVHDRNRPENLDFLKEMRQVLDEYGAVAVGEIGERTTGIEMMGEYTSGGDKLQMCYAFEFLSGAIPEPQTIRGVIERFDAAGPDGWACWAFSNHDVVRHASRWTKGREKRDAILKLAAGILMTLRGSVCIYQGEELGLPEAEIPRDRMVDPSGIALWPDVKTRDGCRTPMVWLTDNRHGGFSDAEPWLPTPSEHLPLAVSEAEADPNSLLAFYRRLIAYRKATPSLVKGTLRFLDAAPGILALLREHEGEAVLCVFNLGDETGSFRAPEGMTMNEPVPYLFGGRLDGNTIRLAAHDGFIAQIEK